MSLQTETKPKTVVVDYSKGNLRSVEKGLALAGAAALVSADADDIARADAIVLPGVGSFADASATMLASGQMQAIRERVRAGVPFLGICLGLQLLFERGDEGLGRRQPIIARSSSGQFAPDPPGQTTPLPQVVASSAQTDLGQIDSKSDAQALVGASPEQPTFEHRWAEGLGLLRGHCRRIDSTDLQGRSYKVPHVGWNQVHYSGDELWISPLFAGIADGSNFYFTHSYQAQPRDHSDIIASVVHARPFTCAVRREQIFATQFHPEKSSRNGLAVLRNFVDFVRGA
ncbi:MAG: imidazole glycerol phosphate synthase subunit HisH [Coriobacteriales bacterium]|jgi:glutamine amidotransferase|nr:imidazole glycerol phosphate synthase subunit HisH [Coriobacteriales bacterium]